MIKVKPATFEWTDTHGGIIVPFSIHSLFHQGSIGTQKVNAMISYITSLTNKPVTVLITEKAHMQTLSLLYGSDIQKTLDVCAADATAFIERFENAFENCTVQFWDGLISKDADYCFYKEELLMHYKMSQKFQQLLLQDAHDAYTPARALEYPDKELFIAKTIEDLLEQSILFFVAAKKEFRFIIYPGNLHNAFKYINDTCLPPEKRIVWVKMQVEAR